MKYKVGFLILHYRDAEITEKCIDSIQKLKQDDFELGIMVVDNNSGNDSARILRERYKDESRMELIELHESKGYSGANNVGYDRMKDQGYDFIFVINNDIVFHQEDILERLAAEFEERPFYVAGPDIYAVYKKRHQSPIAMRPENIPEMEQKIREEKRKLRFLWFENIIHRLYKLTMNTAIYKAYRKKMDKIQKPEPEKDWQHRHENVVLQGACFVVSRLFISAADVLFTPETQFYHEEAILTTRCYQNGWNNVYLPELKITHLDSVATSKKKYYQRKKFRYVNFIQSGEIYLNYLKQIEKEKKAKGDA